MLPRFAFLVATLMLWLSPPLPAFDDGPPISITSPDTASTFVYSSIKNRSLFWNKSAKMLIARVTFTDTNDSGDTNDDSHEFRLPGITLDPVKGIFFATSAKGVLIPVAHFKKTLFITTIEALPNATVRIQRERGDVSVVLEAISPDDPAMHPKPTDANGTNQVDIKKILN